MDRKMISKLQAAGVSADVILKLHLEDEDLEKPEKAEQPEQPEKPEKPEQEKQLEKPVQDSDPVLKAIHELTGAIYASNIMRDGTASAGTETAEDILASVIKGE